MLTLMLFAASGARAALVTIDFSTFGVGQLEPNFYKSSGIVFTRGDFPDFVTSTISIIQGDEALLISAAIGGGNYGRSLTGLFAPRAVTSISVRIAPGFQGTAVYRLVALDTLSEIIDSESLLVTQDSGDPETTGFGYFSLTLDNLPGAVGFYVEETTIRSSAGWRFLNGGISSIRFNTVPEPSSAILVGLGWLGAAYLRRRGSGPSARRAACASLPSGTVS